MSDGKSKVPRLSIEQDEESRAAAAKAAAEREPAEEADSEVVEAAEDASGETAPFGRRRRLFGRRRERVPGAASAHAAREALADADESFTRYAMAHRNTVAGGFLGLVMALLIIFLGFWNTLLIALFVLIGVIIGQALDGDNGIVNFFRRYFGGR